MKLLKHRQDLKWLSTHLPHSDCDEKGCVLCGVIKRIHNLILLGEEADRLYYRGIYTDRARRVARDAGGKK